MILFPRLLFALLLVLAPAVIWGTSGALPERVASHFGHDGLPNGWMTRDGYVMFMLALTIGAPLFAVVVSALAPRAAARKQRMPNAEYWLAPERRDETVARMVSHACWLGCLMLSFFVAMHVLLIQANATVPAQLPERTFIALVVAFVVALIVWALAQRLRFRRTP